MDSKFPQIIVKHTVGNTIEIPNEIDVRASTFLSAATAISAISISVDNAIDFTSGAILALIGSVGNEYAEIATISSHTDQAFSCTALKLPHQRGDIIQELRYDQVEIYKSSTLTGSYTLLQTVSFQVSQTNTIVFDATGLSTDYYKIRWKNSSASQYSDYSEPISVLTYPDNSVAGIIFSVYRAMGIKDDDPYVTIPWGISSLNDARAYTDAKLYGIRQDWRHHFEYPIQLFAGTNYVDLPSDIDWNTTDRSLLAARFLVGNVLTPYNLRYIDKRSWNQIAFSVMGGTTTAISGVGATTITLDSVGDFLPASTSGVAYVATTDYSQTIMQIAYTGVDTSTSQLTGVTGITRSIPVGTRVWSRPTISQPIYYTVYDNRIVFDRIIPDSMQGTNLYIDYYTKLESVTDLYQELPEHYRENYKWYLRWAVKYRKDISISSSDPDLKKFEDLTDRVVDNLYTGQDITITTG
jgi:hypothetical protein